MILKFTDSSLSKLSADLAAYEVHDAEIKGFLVRVQPTGLKTYYFSYRTSEGRKGRIRIGGATTINTSDARKSAKFYAGSVSRGIDPQREKKESRRRKESPNKPTLRTFLSNGYEKYLLLHQKRGQETIDSLNRKFTFLFDKPMTDISIGLIQEWIMSEKERGLKPSTINRYLMMLKSALNSAVRGVNSKEQILVSNPISSVRPLKVDNKREPRYLSTSEEHTIRNALKERDIEKKAERVSANKWRDCRGYPQLGETCIKYFDYITPMVLISINSGCRRGELFGLEWSDVDFEKELLRIQGNKCKSGKTRFIPMNRECAYVFNEWKREHNGNTIVFPSRGGTELATVKKAWANVLQRASIDKFRWHDLRHTFASKLVNNGVDLYVVKELLGHSSLEMTERYSHLAPSKKYEAVQTLSYE
jgi:integrase